MNNKNITCQNCKQQFIIGSEDSGFYERLGVPPPTFCPECRLGRRMAFRNERDLYKRTCDLCHKNIIAMYPADAPFPVYCRDCWYSDNWDPSSYGRDYDFSRPFFDQLGELMKAVPRLFLWQRNVINSEYSSMVGESKNVYLSCSVVMGCENVFYSKAIDASFNIFDSYNVSGSENCYENIDGSKNYNSHHLILSRNCIDSRFLIDCVSCKNCVLSSNLRNKEFYIRNKPYTKEDYFKEIQKMDFGSRRGEAALLKEFAAIKKKALYKFANIVKCVGSTGNNLMNVKDGKYCFDAYDMERARYTFRSFLAKDVMDCDFCGWSELMYEYTTGAKNDYNVRFSVSGMDAIRDAEYTDYCRSGKNLFGCVSLRNRENAILNKTYSSEEFTELRKKIIQHMNDMPYRDKGGREYRYGEFFPNDLSPFAYNETQANDFFPLTAAVAKEKGYRWREPEGKSHAITLPAGSIPDSIGEAGDDILQKTLGCEHEGKCDDQCSVAFRLTRDELQFYKKNSIPIPDKCPNCRYYERFRNVLPPKLWQRKCMCDYEIYPNTVKHAHHGEGRCPHSFESPYAPDRSEVIYCEECYNMEVA